MKWEIHYHKRFETEAEARAVWDSLPKPVKKLFEADDSFAVLGKCYHDEGEVKPCEEVERVEAE